MRWFRTWMQFTPINPGVPSPGHSCPSAYLHLPQGFRTGGRRGRLPAGSSQEHMLLLPVLITGEKFLLLGMKQPHHVPLKVHMCRNWGRWILKEIITAFPEGAKCCSIHKVWNSPPLICRLCYHSISWKGLFSSLYCSWRNWPGKHISLFLHTPHNCVTQNFLTSTQQARLCLSLGGE